MKKIRATAAAVPVVCLPCGRSTDDLLRAFFRHGIAARSCGNAICAELRKTELESILPELCEHSDRVCIGEYYPELFKEHR